MRKTKKECGKPSGLIGLSTVGLSPLRDAEDRNGRKDTMGTVCTQTQPNLYLKTGMIIRTVLQSMNAAEKASGSRLSWGTHVTWPLSR